MGGGGFAKKTRVFYAFLETKSQKTKKDFSLYVLFYHLNFNIYINLKNQFLFFSFFTSLPIKSGKRDLDNRKTSFFSSGNLNIFLLHFFKSCIKRLRHSALTIFFLSFSIVCDFCLKKLWFSMRWQRILFGHFYFLPQFSSACFVPERRPKVRKIRKIHYFQCILLFNFS